MHILIAPNAFKNSLPAIQAAEAIKAGLEASRLKCTCKCFPIGDGGDGTSDLIIRHCDGIIRTIKVNDPLGRRIDAAFGLIDDSNTAVIEMANASGIRLLEPDELDPVHASTFGTGELILAALDEKVRKIIMCIGGSATVDGGVGLLQALGTHFLDFNRKNLIDIPGRLIDLSFIDTSELDNRILDCDFTILCDVENTLLGERGAAAVFGPQKGAHKHQIQMLEARLSKLRDVSQITLGVDLAHIHYGGAAGGVAAGCAAFLNAKLVNGIDTFLDITNFEKELRIADLVITGEGSIDEQTLQGKGPFGVAKKAKEKSIPVFAFGGTIPPVSNETFVEYFKMMLPINPDSMDLPTAMKFTRENLQTAAKKLGDELAENNFELSPPGS